MNLKNAEIYSKDQWLLARLTTDLQMSGIRYYSLLDDKLFEYGYDWLTVYESGYFSIYNFKYDSIKIVYKLTKSNYTEVLTKILGG